MSKPYYKPDPASDLQPDEVVFIPMINADGGPFVQDAKFVRTIKVNQQGVLQVRIAWPNGTLDRVGINRIFKCPDGALKYANRMARIANGEGDDNAAGV